MKHAVGRVCRDKRVCTRTNEPHEEFKNVVEGGKVLSYGTTGTSEFPEELCGVQAEAALSALSNMDLSKYDFCFLEVFCGPNGPLTQAMRKARGLRLLQEPFTSDVGTLVSNCRTLGPNPDGGKQLPGKDYTLYQQQTRSTGWQPRWNPLVQLIPDGLKSCGAHIDRAKMLDHPAYSTAFDNAETTVCADTIASMGESIIPYRIKVVNTFRKRGLELEGDRAEAADLERRHVGGDVKRQRERVSYALVHAPIVRIVSDEAHHRWRHISKVTSKRH